MREMLVAWLFALSAAACGGGGGADPNDEEPQLEDDFRGCPPEIPVFGPGLQAAGAVHSVTLISAQPSEPERYENHWIVELGSPLAALVRGQTFMPVHGHDGGVEPVLKPLAQAGRFAVERLNFTMRGPWQVRLWVSSPAANEELAVFQVCVAK